MGDTRRSATVPQATPEPFLRWAGGKQWLAGEITRYLPEGFGCYYEPFVGGGSVFFALSPRKAVLGDTNCVLIETYRQVRDNPRELIRHLCQWQNSRDTYYRVRSAMFRSPSTRAARTIYLNKTCWNGLFRVNRQGKFNVPYGNTPSRRTHDPDAILNASRTLQGVDLLCADFESVLSAAQAEDLVYLDPPYTTIHSDNGFVRYNETLFSWSDQVRLASVARILVARGCFVIVSNANHSSIRALYDTFVPHILTRRSSLAADPRFRCSTSELLLLSDNLPRPR